MVTFVIIPPLYFFFDLNFIVIRLVIVCIFVENYIMLSKVKRVAINIATRLILCALR